MLKKLDSFLERETNADLIDSGLEVLGHWGKDCSDAIEFLLRYFSSHDAPPSWFTAFARLGRINIENNGIVQEKLIIHIDNPSAAAGLVRFLIGSRNAELMLKQEIKNSMQLFQALVDAGTDSLYQFTSKGLEGVVPPANTGLKKNIKVEPLSLLQREPKGGSITLSSIVPLMVLMRKN